MKGSRIGIGRVRAHPGSTIQRSKFKIQIVGELGSRINRFF